jgi:hypothetical protein
MTFREPFPNIDTEQAGRMLRFYVDAFGFAIDFRWPPESEDAYVADPDGHPIMLYAKLAP